MIPLTCYAYGLRRIDEEICGQFGTVDELTPNMKIIFQKSITVKKRIV